MRLPLTTLEVFTAIATRGSLRAAAEALGVKPATVSHQLKALELHLGTALFIRTTRSVRLTEAGRALLRGTGPAFDQLSDAVESARTTGHAARGTLKVAMPEFVYHMLVGAALPSFRERYPDIEIELSLTDALTEILDEGLHAGFRLGHVVARDMVAVRMTGPLPLTVVGSPEYDARRGFPEQPEDLLDHHCIHYRFMSSGQIAPWTFQGRDGEYRIAPPGGLTVNTLPIAVDLATRGQGLLYIFRDYVAREIASNHLRCVLNTHLPTTPGIFLYFPREYRGMVPLRLFMDHLRAKTT